MHVLWNDLYSQEDYDDILRNIRREAQKERARMQARVLVMQKERLKKQFQSDVKKIAGEAKKELRTVQGHLDEGVKGKVQGQLEKVLEERVQDYANLSQKF